MVEQIVALADEQLYQAKSNGRNRVEFRHLFKDPLGFSADKNKNLVQLVWKSSFCSGNQLIDIQHQSLFLLSNELLEAVLSARPSEEISEIIARLLAEVTRHFHDEERILNKLDYPDVMHHATEHAKLLDKGLKLSNEFNASTLSVGDVFQFLVHDVVLTHMLGEDREYFYYTSNAYTDDPGAMRCS